MLVIDKSEKTGKKFQAVNIEQSYDSYYIVQWISILQDYRDVEKYKILNLESLYLNLLNKESYLVLLGKKLWEQPVPPLIFNTFFITVSYFNLSS